MLSTALLLAVTITGAQPEEVIDPNLKPLTPLVGSWNVTFDWPGIPFKKAKVTYCWALDGKYLKADWTSVDGTELGPEWFTWDPIRKTLRMWGFDADNFYEATWQVDGNKWTGKYSSTAFTGDKTRQTITLEFKGADTVIATQMAKGGTKPGGTAKFVRVKPAE